MKWLRLILLDPLPWVLAAALAASLVLLAVQSLRLAHARVEIAVVQRGHATKLAELERTSRELIEQHVAQRRRWETAQHENAIVADKAREQALRDAAAADAAAQRLRGRFAALAAACHASTGDPATVAAGPAASSPAHLLADVQRRLDEAAGVLATYADRAVISAEHCAADYDALKAWVEAACLIR